MRTISLFIIMAMLFSSSAKADTKTVGKLTMIAILSATAFVVKKLVDRDRKELKELHERFGLPDRSVEFQEGFDHWRVEWYGDHVYIFRNGVLHKQYSAQNKTKMEER